MRLSGGAVSEEMKKRIAIGVFVVIALGVVYFEAKDTLFPPSIPPVAAVTAPVSTAARPVVAAGGTAMKPAVATTASLDPTLHMEAMLVSERVEYSGSGRNIFSAASAPIAIPLPVKPVRVIAAAPQPPPVPCPPNCPPPPPPPPIDLKYFGVKTGSNGSRVACLLQGDTVYLASSGDVVLRRYKVIAIEAKSIQVEDMQNSNRQTLPLQTQ